jgi:hypothetical protein
MSYARRIVCMGLVLCMGCASAPPRPSGPALQAEDYPGALRSSELLPNGLSFRQRVTARFRGQDGSFMAVVETDAGHLRMLALTPFGMRAFLIEQTGQQLAFTSYVEQKMPFPPRFVLLDLHRAFFLGSGEPPLREGERVFTRDGEEIRERFHEGALVARSYRRLDGKPAGSIDIEYQGGMHGFTPPDVLVLHNGWFGYTLTITTLSEN